MRVTAEGSLEGYRFTLTLDVPPKSLAPDATGEKIDPGLLGLEEAWRTLGNLDATKAGVILMGAIARAFTAALDEQFLEPTKGPGRPRSPDSYLVRRTAALTFTWVKRELAETDESQRHPLVQDAITAVRESWRSDFPDQPTPGGDRLAVWATERLISGILPGAPDIAPETFRKRYINAGKATTPRALRQQPPQPEQVAYLREYVLACPVARDDSCTRCGRPSTRLTPGTT